MLRSFLSASLAFLLNIPERTGSIGQVEGFRFIESPLAKGGPRARFGSSQSTRRVLTRRRARFAAAGKARVAGRMRAKGKR